MTYLDPWFRPRTQIRTAGREPARYLDPAFRSSAPSVPAPEPAPEPAPFLRWILTDADRPDFARRVTRAFARGRILFGRTASDGFTDSLGRVIRARTVRGQTVPLLIDHAGPPVGSAIVLPRPDRGDVLACCVLDDSGPGHAAARVVAEGASGFSVGGRQRGPGGWKAGDPFEVEEVSLVRSPQDRTCCALNLNHADFHDFAGRDLGLTRKELPWL